jgi:hypothetical protein
VLPDTGRVLVIGCGALARELVAVVGHNRLDNIAIECLPARLHNTPALIPDAVEARIVRGHHQGAIVFVAYGDCGTGGRLDAVLERHGVDRLPGAHCYEFFMGSNDFEIEHEAEPATFYLTDFLVRHFDRLVWSGLGLDRHPQLLEAYFGNYERVLFISQQEKPSRIEAARGCASRLGLRFEHRHAGYGAMQAALLEINSVSSDAA